MLVNFYLTDLAGNVSAPSTPGDGISINALFGDDTSNDFVAESGAVDNYMVGFGGLDWMFGGGGVADNFYYGGDGVDTAYVASSSVGTTFSIGYYGGMTVTRPGGGIDVVDANTELTIFTNGTTLISFNAGAVDGMTTNTAVQWQPGRALVLSMDWINAYYAGLITVKYSNVDDDNLPDTEFTGAAGINTYTLIDWDFQEHFTSVVGVYGDGAIIELD